MDQTVLFGLFLLALLLAWFGPRRGAIAVFCIALALTVADFLHHATDALKLSPPNPNFLQSRDAILQADLVNTGGANRAGEDAGPTSKASRPW